MALTAERPANSPAGGAVTGARPVLIGFADALSAPEVAWSLLDSGFQVVAFTRGARKPALRRCEGIGLAAITPPEEDAERARTDLRLLLRAGSFGALMPLDDASVWLCDSLAEGLSVPLVGPAGGPARLTLDKRVQLRSAARAGFAVPPTREVHSVDELLALDDLPVALKPAGPVALKRGRLVRGANHICANEAELRAAAAVWDGSSPLLAQSLLHGVGEGLFGLAGTGEVEAWSAHRRIRMMNPHGSGSSACASVPVDPDLADAAARMLADGGWTGMFMLEFLRDRDGTPWFLELNGRPWGSMALARRCGLEYPAWAVKRALDPDFRVPAMRPVQRRVCRHLGRELVHLLMVLRGPRSEAVAGWPSRWRTAREVLRFGAGEHWYNCAPGAPGLFIEDTVRTVLDQLPRGVSAWRGSGR